MIRYILKSWVKHKERFILLIIGVFTISAGLSYLFNIAESNKGTIVNTLQKNWKPSYDIVVRPPESKELPEQKEQLLEPNFLSNIQGGISVDQYNKIKELDHIDVAAPIAMIGYAWMSIIYDIDLSNVNMEPGIYKLSYTFSEDKSYYDRGYFTIGEEYYINEMFDGSPLERGIASHSNQLLVGIDPEAEAKLVGLDDALGKYEENRYFRESDDVFVSDKDSIRAPVLINPAPLSNMNFNFKLKKLNISKAEIKAIPDENPQDIRHSLDDVSNLEEVYSFTATGEQLKHTVFEDTFGVNPFTGKSLPETSGELKPNMLMFFGTSSLKFKKEQSPYPNRWEYTYQVNEKPISSEHILAESFVNNTYRDLNVLSLKDRNNIAFDVLGFYNPDKLDISRNPLSELPMETYRPPLADKVLDADEQPVNPPKRVPSTGSPVGLLTSPPTLLTTIDAAVALNGEEAISAIRIKVEGTGEIGKSSQNTVEQVAKKIEDQTGLLTDITIGSSPQPVLIHVNQIDGEYGWIEQPWIHLGAAITVFNETILGYSGIIASIVAVAIMYVIATNYVTFLSRRKEFGILLAMGWRTKDLRKVIISESLLLGCLAVFILWIISYIWAGQGNMISIWKTVLASATIIVIYLVGTVIPMFGIGKISPYETIRTGEISTRTKRFVQASNRVAIVWNNFFGKIKRNLFSILVIMVPTALVTFFLFITIHLKGVLFTSWLGEYVALEVGPTHYVAVGISVLIALLTTAEIMWQNVSERKSELALLKAIGWRNSSVRSLILLEGLFVGMAGAVLGTILAAVILIIMYGSAAIGEMYIYLISGAIPIVIGFLGSLLPSQLAIKIIPYEGMRKN